MIDAYRKTVAISQSNYIPWKGYFDLIQMADEFVLFDTAQYTRRDWRNRNRIKTPNGAAWLTIPVVVKGRYLQTVQETEISDGSWNEYHWKTIVHNYARAPHFEAYRDCFEELYLGCREKLLSRINFRFLVTICEILGIKTHVSWSCEYPQVGGQTERLVKWCRELKATEYISGPAAKAYIDESLFMETSIKVRYMDYSGYPEYKQLYGPFDHAVSIVDLIFNEGPNATRYMKGFNNVHAGLAE